VICLQRVGKATRNFTQDSRIPGPPEYEGVTTGQGTGLIPGTALRCKFPYLFKNALSNVDTSQ
jgi:hypothetical protein